MKENKYVAGITPRIEVTDDFIKKFNFQLKSEEEVLEKIGDLSIETDPFNFQFETLADSLSPKVLIENFYTSLNHEYIDSTDENDDTRPTLKEIVQDMLDYMVFAWMQAVNQKGLSAERSRLKLMSFAFLLNHDEVYKIISKEYDNYGKDNLLELFNYLELYNPEEL